MDVLLYLIPVALVVGGVALAGFLWALKSGQFDDMEGAANRILFDDTPEEEVSQSDIKSDNSSQSK